MHRILQLVVGWTKRVEIATPQEREILCSIVLPWFSRELLVLSSHCFTLVFVGLNPRKIDGWLDGWSASSTIVNGLQEHKETYLKGRGGFG